MRSLLAVAALMLTTSGCYHRTPPRVGASSGPYPSPVAGTWLGHAELKAGDTGSPTGANRDSAHSASEGPSEISLWPTGTGFLKVAGMKEIPIVWKQEGRKVILESRGIDRNGRRDPSPIERRWVATLSKNRKTMTLEMEHVVVALRRP